MAQPSPTGQSVCPDVQAMTSHRLSLGWGPSPGATAEVYHGPPGSGLVLHHEPFLSFLPQERQPQLFSVHRGTFPILLPLGHRFELRGGGRCAYLQGVTRLRDSFDFFLCPSCQAAAHRKDAEFAVSKACSIAAAAIASRSAVGRDGTGRDGTGREGSAAPGTEAPPFFLHQPPPLPRPSTLRFRSRPNVMSSPGAAAGRDDVPERSAAQSAGVIPRRVPALPALLHGLRTHRAAFPAVAARCPRGRSAARPTAEILSRVSRFPRDGRRLPSAASASSCPNGSCRVPA